MQMRQVTIRKETALRYGRGREYDPVYVLPALTVAPYVDSREGWVRVHLEERKLSGWVVGSDVRVQDTDADPAPDYSVAPGAWSIRLPDIEVSLLLSGGNGWLQIKGNLPEPLRVSTDENDLVVAGGFGAGAGWLDVGDRGCTGLEVGADSVVLHCDRRPAFAVAGQSSSRLRVRLFARAEGQQSTGAAGRELIDLDVSGWCRPATGAVRNGVILSLPACQPAPGFPRRWATDRATVTVQTGTAGMSLAVAATQDYPFLLRQSGNTTRLELLDPGPEYKLVVIDPGHGGFDDGAGSPGGLREADVNLAIALRLEQLLQEAGLQVLMTRREDTSCAPPGELDAIAYPRERQERDFSCRCTLANSRNADLFISIHNNANQSPDVSGTTTYWCQHNANAERSQALAELVQAELVGALGSTDNGVQTDVFWVTRYTDCPAVLAEVLFLTNADDEATLRDPDALQTAAEGLARAVSRFFGMEAVGGAKGRR